MRPRARAASRLTILILIPGLALGGCGSSSPASRSSPASSSSPAPGSSPSAGAPLRARPQAIEPAAGQPAVVVSANDPVGDPNAHAPSLAVVKAELRLELIAAPVTSASYINPLQFVTVWGRTDQGVDASLPVGAPIIAPCRIKVLAIIPNWYAGQPLVYFELLDGPDAGRVQFVAEQITQIAPPGSILQRGAPIARYAATGTNIEYGWSTVDGVTLARATTGYEEGQRTPAGRSIRAWLVALGAPAGAS